jgi:RHS repeat-associated protein
MDFKGNLLAFERRVIADRPLLATYEQAAGNGWQVPDFAVDWTPAPGQTQAQRDDELLEPAGYAIDRSYDALGRVTRQLTPADAAGARHELRPRHNRAGALEQVSFDGAVHVDRIAYNARGQRTLIAYGNGVMTRYAYEPATSRLARVRTEPYAADGATYRPAGAVLQDLGYRYDLAGNVVAIADRTPGSGIPDNPQALGAASPRLRALLGSGDALDREFRHDPTYRLVRATGREVDAPTVQPWSGQPRSTDTTRAQAFTETYVYDAVNSLLQLRHNADGGGTRVFTVDPESNRVQTLAAGTTVYDYAYDACGNLLAETTSRHFGWNHADQLVSYATQTAGAEPSVHVHYLYDAAGDRVKKLVRRQGGGYEVTHYLEGGFEHHRWGAAPEQQNNHVHVGEDTARIALVRLGPAHPDDPAPAVQYQLTDQVGSSSALLDAAGALINREEFTPFGETSFGSYARKRYRFTGQERDEETGMTYHRARYCAPWLARWASADPLGIEAGANGYSYCGNSPLEFRDPAGLDRVETVGTENPYGALAMAQVTGLVDVISESRFEEITRWQVKNTDAAAAEWKHAWSFDEARELAEADGDTQRAMVQAKWSRFVNDKYDVYYDEQVAKWDDATRRMENAGKAGKLIAKVTLGVIAGAGPLASSYLAIGGVATAKQLGFGLLLAGATSSGDTSGCGGLAAMGGGAMPTKSGPGAALPATRAAGTATEAEALAPLQAETVGGQRVFYAGPEGAGSTVGLRYHEGGLVTADTIFPARFAGVRRYSGIIENHLGLRGPTPKLWLSGVHGTPQGLLTREVRFLHIDREVLGRRTTSGWTVGDVLNPGGVTVEDPAATFLAWCHSTALCR